MVLRPLGHRLLACLPALLLAELSIIHLSGSSSRGHPHSMQISIMQQRCHTLSLSLGHRGQSHKFTAGSRKIRPTSPHYFLHLWSIDTSLFFAPFSAAALVNKRVSGWFTGTKIEQTLRSNISKTTEQNVNTLTCRWKMVPVVVTLVLCFRCTTSAGLIYDTVASSSFKFPENTSLMIWLLWVGVAEY